MRSQNSVGFPYILLIEMLLKSPNLRETWFNPTTLIRLIVSRGRVCRGPTLKWAEITRFRLFYPEIRIIEGQIIEVLL